MAEPEVSELNTILASIAIALKIWWYQRCVNDWTMNLAADEQAVMQDASNVDHYESLLREARREQSRISNRHLLPRR